jgi:hypothetical protein
MVEQDWLEIEGRLLRAYQQLKTAIAEGANRSIGEAMAHTSRHKKAPDDAGAFELLS